MKALHLVFHGFLIFVVVVDFVINVVNVVAASQDVVPSNPRHADDGRRPGPPATFAFAANVVAASRSNVPANLRLSDDGGHPGPPTGWRATATPNAPLRGAAGAGHVMRGDPGGRSAPRAVESQGGGASGGEGLPSCTRL